MLQGDYNYNDNKDLVCIGTISGAFGTQGDVKISYFCESSNTLKRFRKVVINGYKDQVELKVLKILVGKIIVRFPTIRTREEANYLSGRNVFCHRESFPVPEENEYYYADLKECEVFDNNGIFFGKVTGVFNYGAGDILEIEETKNLKKILLPFTKEYVPKVNISKKAIVINSLDLAK